MRSLGSRPWSVQDDEVEQLQAQKPGSVPRILNSEAAKASAQAHTHAHTAHTSLMGLGSVS